MCSLPSVEKMFGIHGNLEFLKRDHISVDFSHRNADAKESRDRLERLPRRNYPQPLAPALKYRIRNELELWPAKRPTGPPSSEPSRKREVARGRERRSAIPFRFVDAPSARFTEPNPSWLRDRAPISQPGSHFGTISR